MAAYVAEARDTTNFFDGTRCNTPTSTLVAPSPHNKTYRLSSFTP
jgi:hypothetical protein